MKRVNVYAVSVMVFVAAAMSVKADDVIRLREAEGFIAPGLVGFNIGLGHGVNGLKQYELAQDASGSSGDASKDDGWCMRSYKATADTITANPTLSAIVAALGVYVPVALNNHLFPFNKATSDATATVTATPTVTATATGLALSGNNNNVSETVHTSGVDAVGNLPVQIAGNSNIVNVVIGDAPQQASSARHKAKGK